MDELRQLLEDEMKQEIVNLSNLNPGSDEHSIAVDSLAKLYKLKIEEVKTEWDFDEKYNRRVMEDEHNQKQIDMETEARTNEEQFKKEQLAEQIKDRYFKYGVEVGLGVLTLMFYGAWMKKGFKFEETGTFTSTTFRGLFNRFRPTKK